MAPTRRLLSTAAALVAVVALVPAVVAAQTTAYAFVPNSGTDNVSVVDARTRLVVGAPIAAANQPQGMATLPDGRKAYVAHLGANTVIPIDVSTRTAGTPIDMGGTALGLVASPDGRRVYVTGFSNSVVRVIDTTTDTVVATIPGLGANPASIAVTPDGQRLYVSNSGGSTVSVIDTTTNAVVGSPITVGASPGGLMVTPNGQRVYVPNFASNTVSVIDTATNTVVATIPVGNSPNAVAISADGSLAVVSNFISDNVSFITTATNSVTSFAAGNGPFGVSFTPDGLAIFVVDYDGDAVTFLDASTGANLGSVAIGVDPYTLSPFMTPAILTTACGGCTALTIDSDAALSTKGVRRFVVFDTGILQLTAPWTSTRDLTLLAGGGTIDTQTFAASVAGTSLGGGQLTKTGTGTLTLSGAAAHGGGTRVQQGTLAVTGSHAGTVHVQGGTLAGTGTVGGVDATSGGIAPGVGGPGILTAAQASISGGTVLAVQLNGATAGTGYDRLAVTGTATISNAVLNVSLGYAPAPGTVFTILTHASGTFTGLAEGAVFSVGGTFFRITYQAGSGTDVALLVDAPPTITGPIDQTFNIGFAPAPIPFTVGDDFTPASSLLVSATSSNTALLPNSGIVLGGSGANRTITMTPTGGATGVTTVTIAVGDGLQTAQRTFTLTVQLPTYTLGEGATGSFFTTDLLLANPTTGTVQAAVTYFKDSGVNVTQNLALAPQSRVTVRVNEVPGMEAAAFSTRVVSTGGVPIVVERTMWWDAASTYGAHTEKASPATATDWYFAEGSQGYFSTYFLLLNPNTSANVAHVTYFLDGGSPVTRDYPMVAGSRLTIDAGSVAQLVNRSFGARVHFDLPGMAERAMYFGGSPLFSGGHASAGVVEPSTSWLLAEGATGSFFDTFVLIANPSASAATITATYLPATGAPIVRTHDVPAGQRLTINIALEDAALASAAVSVQLTSTQPIVVERAQYWPHGNWQESHGSPGETASGLRWGLAEGRVGGANGAQTYVLIANPGTIATTITATFLRTTGAPIVKTFIVAPQSRFNIAVTGPGSNVPELSDESFGVVIDSTQPILVERSLYTNAGGVIWAAGTNATGTRLP